MRWSLPSLFVPAFTLFLALAAAAPRASIAESGEEGFKPLFNGKTLDGWRKVGGGATYRVEDGTIVGEVGPGPNTFLRTEATYGDFILKLEVKLDVPGNSGIQFRSHQRNGNGRVYGYQCEIDPSPRAWSGGIYDEARRGWLYPLKDDERARKAFRLDGWNEYVIEARGPFIKTWVNGVPCADLVDTMDMEGFIALQVHSGKQGRIRWRNIRIKDLGRSRWKPLWDGKTFAGWRKIGPGEWTILEGGVLKGTHKRSEPGHGHLITEKRFGDFCARLRFRAVRGNSGFYFRVEEGGGAGVLGFQAEIDPERDVGGLYETGGRGWVVRPSKEFLDKYFRKGDWNELSVTAKGGRIVVHLNGRQSAELRNDPGRKEGHLALQLHGGQDVEVYFRGIELLESSAF